MRRESFMEQHYLMYLKFIKVQRGFYFLGIRLSKFVSEAAMENFDYNS